MLSKLANEDILTLMEIDGIKLSPSEIVRLNALGLLAEKDFSPDNDLYTLPRVAIVCGMYFYEPTIGHEIWIDDVLRLVDQEDISTRTAIEAYALSVKDPDELPKPTIDKILPELFKFRRKVRALRPRQLIQALDYVKDGRCHTDGEHPYYKAKNSKEKDYTQMSISLGVLLDGVVSDIGLSLADEMKLTRSQLQMMVLQKLEYEGRIDEKKSRASKMANYYRTLDHIKQQHLEEKKNGIG